MAEQRARAEQAEPAHRPRCSSDRSGNSVLMVAISSRFSSRWVCIRTVGNSSSSAPSCGKLCVGRGDGKARRHRVTLPAGAVPAADQIAAVGDGGGGRRQQSRRPVAVHHRVAGDHADVASVRGRKQRFGRGRMRRAIGASGGGAVARQFVEEKFGVARGVRRIGEFLLLDEGVFLQPFEQLRAVGGDHLGLRIMDMRIDEARHDQRVGVMLDRHVRRQARRELRPPARPLRSGRP